MKNYDQIADVVRLTVGSGVVAGDPVLVGDIGGVAETDYDSSDGKAEVRVRGACTVTVKGEDGSGAAAIGEGDTVYFDVDSVNADSANGTKFGKLLGTVSSGASPERSVMLVQ